MTTTEGSLHRRLPIGAEVSPGGLHFRVWAPDHHQVELIANSDSSKESRSLTVALRSEEDGYFSAFEARLKAGARYGFRLDGQSQVLPDPASRFQPDGPDGLSQVVDPAAFSWTDQSWSGLGATGQVIYEMHLGTFTTEGTWRAAADQLAELRRIGFTALEILPVADFPGRFGWGYDGVCLFAPTRLYGLPDDFRRFVDQAHHCGLGVILDVVYNHFGPVGNHLPKFAANYVNKRAPGEWGAVPNFDGADSRPVREFVLANVQHWIAEYHLDGLRFDATQAVMDSSEPHILTELVETARAAAEPRSIFLTAENEPQDVRMVRPAAEGGHAMDAVWNDDFHHAALVRLTGHNEAYYSDYRGSAAEFVAAVKRAFLYQGQRSNWQKKPRGTLTTGLPATAFVHFLQNHDQVANSAAGARVGQMTSPGRLRAMTALWLLSPQTPLFFQGQEFASSSPFLFFADHEDDQARQVASGRGKFLSQFPSLKSEAAQRALPDPAERRNFERCRLDFSERQSHGPIYRLHQDLLRLRRDDPVFRRQRSDLLDAAPLGPDGLVVRYFEDQGCDRLLVVNFGIDLHQTPCPEPLLALPRERSWQLLWSSNRFEYGGFGPLNPVTDEGWLVPGESAAVLIAAPREKSAEAPQTSESS
jgi:maltooligosyltrehalose trehalohydrolase